jgi:hypothetical protein
MPNAYWAQSNGNYDPAFIFQSTATDDTELELVITSNFSDDIGWYTTSGGSILRHPLYGSGDLPEKFGVTIPANTTFGFYLFNGTDFFYTNSGINTADVGIQHFTLFRNVPSSGTNVATDYYIGAEDARANTDFDYQDIIIHIAPLTGGGGGGGGGGGAPFPEQAAVPEPSGLILLATAVTCLAFLRRLRC